MKTIELRLLAGEAGASLLETMVASVIGLIVVGAALDVFVTHHAHFIAQRTTSGLQEDIRGGVNLLAAELRLAAPITAMQAENIDFRANVNDIRGRVIVAANQGHTIVQVTSSSGWVRGKTVRFCSPSWCEDQVLARDGTSGHLSLTDPLLHDFPEGSQVEAVNQVRYYLNRSVADNWKIMREIDHGANPLIEHVNSFSLTYLTDSGAMAARPEDIRLVRLTLQTSGNNGQGRRLTRNHTQIMGVRTL